MADGYEGFDKSLDYREGGGGGSFVMGLLTGTVLGAGLGMLFAPKAGSELRSQLSEQAGNVANQASEGYRRASESATQWAEKGREVYNKASDAVAKGAQEAQRYVRDTTSSYSGSEPSSSPSSGGSSGSGYGGSTYGSSSEAIRGSADADSSSTRSIPGTGSTGSSSSRRS
jgi:gas vesicle protein